MWINFLKMPNNNCVRHVVCLYCSWPGNVGHIYPFVITTNSHYNNSVQTTKCAYLSTGITSNKNISVVRYSTVGNSSKQDFNAAIRLALY